MSGVQDESEEPIPWDEALALVDDTTSVFQSIETHVYYSRNRLTYRTADEQTICKDYKKYRLMVEVLKSYVEHIQMDSQSVEEHEEVKFEGPVDWDNAMFLLGQARVRLLHLYDHIHQAERRRQNQQDPQSLRNDFQIYRYLVRDLKQQVCNLRPNL
jgi:hypothetical protein